MLPTQAINFAIPYCMHPAPDPQIPLTTQQKSILETAGNLRINAVAGSGKTTTVVAYAASRPEGSRILYLAFNKTVRLEAQRRFAAAGLHNVAVETAHSLAYKHIVLRKGYEVRSQGYTPFDVAQLLSLGDAGEKHGAYLLAAHVIKFASLFCNSSAPKVQALDYLNTVGDEKAKAFVRTHYRAITEGTRLLLKKMNDGAVAITHDFYLKLFQLSSPRLPYDYILFDEGQDASPAMLDVFLKQQAIKLIVGDAHQQIYSWRHAINAMDAVPFPSLPLSTSFRFGKDIADLGVAVLNWKTHLSTFATTPVIEGKGNHTAVKTKAVLARTNLGLLLHAINYIDNPKNGQRIYFEGNLMSYTYADEGASLYDVLNLYNGRHDRIRDKLIASMNSMADLEEYIEKTEDPQLGAMVELVEKYGNEIPVLMKELKSKQVPDEERAAADVIFSTVHRAKGMEYDEVQLVPDFINEAKLEKIKADATELKRQEAKLTEEINLLYVAITRAKAKLLLPENLIPKAFTAGGSIQVVKKESPAEAQPINKPAYLQTLLTYKNSGSFWNDERDAQLRKLFHDGIKLTAIAAHFGCKPATIVSRLRKLGCVDE